MMEDDFINRNSFVGYGFGAILRLFPDVYKNCNGIYKGYLI
jgi:hypothetical protein